MNEGVMHLHSPPFLLASGNRFFIQLTQFVNAALLVSIRYTKNVKGVSSIDVTFHVSNEITGHHRNRLLR